MNRGKNFAGKIIPWPMPLPGGAVVLLLVVVLVVVTSLVVVAAKASTTVAIMVVNTIVWSANSAERSGTLS
jgi:hypothetical protein